MIITLTFKTPDVINHAIENLTEEEQQEAVDVCRDWVSDGEYLTVDINTDTGECVPRQAR